MKGLKLFLLYACFFLLSNTMYAQKSVFVLVDVSGNPLNDPYKITRPMRQEAIDLVEALIINQYDKRFATSWKLSGHTDPTISSIVNGKGQPLISQGDHLMIMPFGEKNTYQNFVINRIQNYPQDFQQYYRFPYTYTDQRTFRELARARAAEIALNANIDNYFLIVILGKGEDTASETYLPQERKYLDNYESSVVVNSLSIFRYRDDAIDYKIKISSIDIKKMRGKQGVKTVPPVKIRPRNVTRKSLEIVAPQGLRKKPFKTKGERLVVSWTCLGCADNTEFTVRLKNLTSPAKPINKKSRTFSTSVQLEAGLYQVTVSGDGVSTKQPQYVQVKSGGGCGGGFLVVLLLGALGGLGYWGWKNFIRDQDKKDSSNSGSDIFKTTQPSKSSDTEIESHSDDDIGHF